jgi:hypothetical protein
MHISQKALPFAVLKPLGKRLRFSFGKFEQAAGRAFNLPLCLGEILLGHLVCNKAKKICLV